MADRDVSTIPVKIMQDVFLEMNDGYTAHPQSNKIHLNQQTKTGDYVSNGKFRRMLTIWIAFRKANEGRRPNYIWTVEPPADPTPAPKPVTKPSPIPELEKALDGTINDFNDFYALIQKHGVYSHYNCMSYMSPATLEKYGIKVAIQRIRNGGLNCADYAELGIKVLEALKTMGVNHAWKVRHVLCNNRNHIPDHHAGHYLLNVDSIDADLAEAASGGKGRPHNMCLFGYNKDGIIGDTIC